MATGPTIWCITDGKPGHLSQLRGLAAALGRQADAVAHEVAAAGPWASAWDWTRGRTRPGAGLDRPWLVAGAGRATHLSVLAAGRATGAATVVLMKPSLPAGWFDLCVAPEHDALAGPNVVATRGALNPMRPAARREPGRGLILIGGPSKHHGWDADALIEQVHAVTSEAEGQTWTLTTSRRTPAETADRLVALSGGALTVVPFAQTGPGWVADQLDRAEAVWVTEDSVSMVYESLTAGAAVGTLAVPRTGTSRVLRGVEALVSRGLVTPFEAWRSGAALRPPAEPLAEADRVAQVVLERLGP